MEISWLGHSCFQLRGKNVTLVTDPFAPQQDSVQGEALRQGKVTASIITVSNQHAEHNYVEGVLSKGDKGSTPRVVQGPGEYEISDVLITGVASSHNTQRGQTSRRNTIYIIHIDEIVVCHLGILGHPLQEEQLEAVADADILFVPIGGGDTLNASQASEVISQVEPRVVIPMHYPFHPDETAPALATFCREMGVESINPQPKLQVTRNSLPAEMQVIVLSPR